jgi:hypothetical protein
MPSKKIIAVALVAAITICLTPSARAQTLDWIRLGSWNIENLPRGTGQPAPALAEYLRLSGVDILALQEIHDTDVGPDRKNERLDEVVAILNQDTSLNWTYQLFANKVSNDTSQLVGVVWNTRRVSIVGNPFRIPVVDNHDDQFDAWDRHPHAVKFSAANGKTDFVIIAVHMSRTSMASNLVGSSEKRKHVRWSRSSKV